jgi:hypothetical protein
MPVIRAPSPREESSVQVKPFDEEGPRRDVAVGVLLPLLLEEELELRTRQLGGDQRVGERLDVGGLAVGDRTSTVAGADQVVAQATRVHHADLRTGLLALDFRHQVAQGGLATAVLDGAARVGATGPLERPGHLADLDVTQLRGDPDRLVDDVLGGLVVVVVLHREHVLADAHQVGRARLEVELELVEV